MKQQEFRYGALVGASVVVAIWLASLADPGTFGVSGIVFGQTTHHTRESSNTPTDPHCVAGSSCAGLAAARLRFEAGPEIFPQSWREAPFFAQASPICESQKERATRIVAREIERYPRALIERTLPAVFLVGSLRFYQRQAFSGTASARAVYLAVQAPDQGYTDQHLAKTFHREYSTLLLNWNLDKIDFDAWQRVNPPDFQYLDGNSWDGDQQDGGSRAIDQGTISLALSQDSADLKHGFLAQYARSSLENDFNEYAARLFTGSAVLWELAEEYPAIATKCELAIRFYHQLHPDLDEAFFRALAQKN